MSLKKSHISFINYYKKISANQSMHMNQSTSELVDYQTSIRIDYVPGTLPVELRNNRCFYKNSLPGIMLSPIMVHVH